MDDLIRRADAIEVADAVWSVTGDKNVAKIWDQLKDLPSAQPERLTDDDFETIRIHLSAHKEKLCNQQRWEEAEEYQRIIDRFMAFASAQRKGKWMFSPDHAEGICTNCHYKIYGRPYQNTYLIVPYNYCPTCGADMRGEQNE